MHRFLIPFLYFILVASAALAQVRSVRGVVRDAKTNEKLAFVSIAANDGETGTTTNLEGQYQLRHSKPIQTLRFSYVGYEPQIVYLDSQQVINVYLQPSAAQLQEVVVMGTGENPAHRIIRLATQNRDRNTIDNLPAYTYRTYNKFIVTAVDAKEIDLGDTLRLSQQDSAYLNMRNLLAKQHLFLMESITDYAYLKPDKVKETILATRVSGLQQPSFGVVAAESRDFSVYEDMPVFFGKRYLSPLSPGSTRKYDFVLQETNIVGQDTVFVISYKPEQGKNFEGLEGLLYINSNGWAVQNVLAQSAANDDKRGIKLQQRFERTSPQNRWFLTELDAEITIPQLSFKGHQPYGRLRTYITNININPNLRKSDFGVIALAQKPDAHLQPDQLYQQYRPDSLTAKEQFTYTRMDSVGRADKLDRTIRLMEYLIAKQISLGPISLDINRLFKVSAFEGVRLGAGAHTNGLFSERVILGGYWGYGFKDEEAKYGADAAVILHKPSELQVKAIYFEDVLEPGGRRLPFQQKSLFTDLRPNLLTQRTYATHKSIALSGRLSRYLQAQTQLRQEQHRPTLFTPEDAPLPKYNLTEAVVSLRYAYGEKYMQQFNQVLPMASEYPVLWLQYTRGLDGVLNGDYSYNKYEARLEASARHRTFGQSSIKLTAGLVDGDAPFFMLFNGFGSNNPNYKFYAAEGFETMRPYEFFSDRYAALLFSQNFGKRFLRNSFFKPDVIVVTNIGFGDLKQAVQDVPLAEINSMRKGFYESGLILNNVISSAFTGIGVGGFYRYGPYAFDEEKDNLRVKLTLTVAF
ncbi:DUF5686 and carboxypeptidase-like regulatory domain-containing protein [Pontibacter cellulosilyticus]|uniref:Carboxypeptidase-like regulatory domain-containing protein n=1 Tax=Pontibacter cellulosilyticus TaxID=1720253 RepID=A0A923SJJ0_9BACT|nr:DUF5686 and carboxypeptidase-like regulatory domain-containing protein [Pontibacter cellulosilyticus]MBC5993878.1 carboxypeptidase-like regulatory domain-containing protein [Pontibacter cellulosilyticus]